MQEEKKKKKNYSTMTLKQRKESVSRVEARTTN